MRLLALLSCLIALCGQAALADTPVAAPTGTTTANGITYTDADASQAVQAVLSVANDHAFLLGFLGSPPANMPPWDPIAYYAGPQKIADGRTAYVVYVAGAYQSSLGDLAHQDHAVASAIASAVFLAVMDGGLAGTKWKAWYDQAASQDEASGAAASDPYAHRHALVAQLADTQTVVYESIGAGSPIEDTAGNPLTEPIDYGTGLIGDARLGVGAARLTDLFDYSDALKQPSVQSLIDDWFAHFSAALNSDDARSQLAQQRTLFAYSTSADYPSAENAFESVLLSMTKSMHDDQSDSFAVGLEVSEIRYNATLTHRVDVDSGLRSAVGETNELDGAVPNLKALRAQLAAAKSGDWSTITAISQQIVLTILAGQ